MTNKKRVGREDGEILTILSSFHLEADRSRGGLALQICGIIGISDFADDFEDEDDLLG